ncbi:outer membrane lipoprotein carrier protein LolA [Guyparkeria hydrothermalis]|uniref:outer membrane lipoprotein carrier protein LolA n=1 Tax=Guyparkeria hydrothermalis TaxID=923 RepID=UPI002021B6A1|nr:outer membrane lipoprotein carrier protein LolA [Guyparkeria hydrothermalis]MCL7751222.1 outer membrane lipoprotein carrier protein LolA [Guyparkeria hydrothermalis]
MTPIPSIARRLLAPALLLPGLLCLPLPTLAIELETLAAALAARGADSTTYEQTRYLGILDEPLESSGRLAFEPPDRLVQEQLAPEPRTLILDGEEMTYSAAGRERVVSLDDSPQGAALAASLRGILNGQVEALRDDYELVLRERAGDGWQLNLLPLTEELADRIRRIEVIGQFRDQRAEVERMTLEFANGDRSVMRLGVPAGDAPDREPTSP